MMKPRSKKPVFFFLIVFSILTLAAAIPYAQEPNKPSVVLGPVITGVTDNEAWVTWSTARPEALKEFELTGPQDNRANLTPINDPTDLRYHRVHLTGLEENTTYQFNLKIPYKDQPSLSTGSFKTAPKNSGQGSFKFIVYGDNRNCRPPCPEEILKKDHEALVKAINKNDPEAALLVSTGDLALNCSKTMKLSLNPDDDCGYTEFFRIERPLLSQKPILAAFGNHEKTDPSYFNQLFHFNKFINWPNPDDKVYYYASDWGNVRFIFLDSVGCEEEINDQNPTPMKLESPTNKKKSCMGEKQLSWLKGELDKAQIAQKLTFIITHHGAYSYGDKHGGLKEIQIKVKPLMEEYAVPAMFSGHDHYYQRIREKDIYFIVVGAGGAPMYNPNPSAPGVIAARKMVSYLVVTVKDRCATAQAKDVNGTIIDSFGFLSCLNEKSNGAK
jgi:predicted MPP superfamily phosphohydrolase